MKVSCEEAVQVLERIARREVAVEPAPDTNPVNRKWVTADGWTIEIFNDSGEPDYLESITSPDGRRGCFEDWMDDLNFHNPLDEMEDEALLMEVLEWNHPRYA